MYWRVGKSVQLIIATNLISARAVFLNIMYEIFTIVSNMTVIFADYFFSDWLSMAYYVGDLIYRIIIVRHPHEFNLYYPPKEDEVLLSDISLI